MKTIWALTILISVSVFAGDSAQGKRGSARPSLSILDRPTPVQGSKEAVDCYLSLQKLVSGGEFEVPRFIDVDFDPSEMYRIASEDGAAWKCSDANYKTGLVASVRRIKFRRLTNKERLNVSCSPFSDNRIVSELHSNIDKAIIGIEKKIDDIKTCRKGVNQLLTKEASLTAPFHKLVFDVANPCDGLITEGVDVGLATLSHLDTLLSDISENHLDSFASCPGLISDAVKQKISDAFKDSTSGTSGTQVGRAGHR